MHGNTGSQHQPKAEGAIMRHTQLKRRLGVESLKGLVVNQDDKPYTNSTYVLSNEFGVFAVCFTDCLLDALDAAADSGHLDCLAVPADEPQDQDQDSLGFMRLGNYSKLYNIASLTVKAFWKLDTSPKG
jgi:hypothetical protein